MDTALAQLNLWAEQIISAAWPLFWQSSVLIALLLALDLGLRKQLRASVRYALWLVLLLKLILPPTLALPTGIGWWARQRSSVPAKVEPSPGSFVVRYGPPMSPLGMSKVDLSTDSGSHAILTPSARMILFSGSVSLGLFAWMLIRWRRVMLAVQPLLVVPEGLNKLFVETRRSTGFGGGVRLRIVDQAMSPAVCGLFRPTVLVPRALVKRLSGEQMRAILLHELIHLKRGDVWVNCAQALLQIAYWWHPLLWLANARIRRVREEAVDDAVMAALQGQADTYAPTLVEVAKLALGRQFTTLGLVGILESPGALRQRIERLLDFRPPHRAGLTVASLICVMGFAAVAVPMGPAPANPAVQSGKPALSDNPWPDRRFSGYHNIALEPRFLIADEISLRGQFPTLVDSPVPLIFKADELISLDLKLSQTGARPHTWAQPLKFEKFSGGSFHWLIGGSVSNQVNYLTRETGGKLIVTGADATFVATEPDWRALELNVVPWFAERGIRCQLRLGLSTDPVQAKEAELIIPSQGAAVWAVLADPSSHKYQLVVLQESPSKTETAGSSTPVTNSASRINALVHDAKLSLPQPNSHARTNLALTSKGRQAIVTKLDRIRIDEVGPWENLPLADVVKILAEQAKRRDPSKLGINFLINPNINTGAATPSAAPQTLDVGSIQVRLNLALHDLRLADVLDAIVKASDHPIKYSIEDYAVVFSLKGLEAAPLYTRVIKVDPTTFAENLRNLTGAAPEGTNSTIPGLKEFFSTLGLDLTPPKTLYYKDREGVLLVRASLADIDLLESAIHELNTAPPQINVKVKFVELPLKLSNLFWEGLTNGATREAILTEPQALVALKALETKEGVGVVKEGSVTTLSGRQTHFEWVDLQTVVTATNGTGTGLPGGAPVLATSLVRIGPVVDIYPFVGADGFTIQLTVSASTSAFLGYDDPGQFVALVPNAQGDLVQPLTAPLPLPRFRVLQIPTHSAVVWDGQTLVLGRSDQIDTNQIPVFGGERPLLGRLFRSEPKDKDFIIFLTPTIIDPAGNRVHSDDERPGQVPKTK